MVRRKNDRSEPLEVRIAFTDTRLRGVKARGYRRILQQIVRAWLDGEPLPAGFEFDISWRNRENKNPLHSNWKTTHVGGDDSDDDDSADARDTLNHGGWLASAVGRMDFARAGRNRRRTREGDDDE